VWRALEDTKITGTEGLEQRPAYLVCAMPRVMHNVTVNPMPFMCRMFRHWVFELLNLGRERAKTDGGDDDDDDEVEEDGSSRSV